MLLERKMTIFKQQLTGISLAGFQRADTALALLEYIRNLKKDEIRKNGDAGINHELDGCLLIMSFPKLDINIRLDLVILYLIHDAHEDYNIQFADVSKYGVTHQDYNRCVAISKIRNGVKISVDEYKESLVSDPLVSFAKGVDRYVNLCTMQCFPEEKRNAQKQETEDLILPVLKHVRQHHPEYKEYAQMLKMMIISLCNWM